MRAVLLDLYDTIAWTELLDPPDRLNEHLGVSRRDLHRAYDLTRIGRGTGLFGSAEGDMGALMVALGIQPDPARARELTRRHLELLPGRTHLYEDTLPVLRELRARGSRIAVISNCDHATRPVIDAMGLESEVDALLLSFEVGALKPDPAIFRMALRRLDAEPEQAIFVDDQRNYLDGAAQLGMKTFAIVRDARDPDGSDPGGAAGAHPVIRDLRALL